MSGTNTSFKRIVVKLGTSILTGGQKHLSPRRMLEIVQQIAYLHESGYEVVIVSSGAMAAGRGLIGDLELHPYIPAKQMLSAMGQPRIMHIYSDLFAIYNIHVAQVLLTRSDLSHRQRYLNSRDTLDALIMHGIVPIINENDTIATEEIRLGDNDNLSAHVANLIDADLLVLLTDQPGLFDHDPRTTPEARLIPKVEEINDAVFDLAGGAGSQQGTGGMVTKLQAAQLATRSGTTVVIAPGAKPNVLIDLVGSQSDQIGTWFQPTASHLESFRRWILSEKTQGTIRIDEGAVKTLRKKKVSLLPIGVTHVQGEFERGVIISITGPNGEEIARGLTDYSASALREIAGKHSQVIEETLGYTYGDQVMRRDRLVLV